MSDNHKISLKALLTYVTSIDKLGAEKTASVLEDAIAVDRANANGLVDFIFLIVCKEFSVTKNEIKTGTSADGRRFNANLCLIHLFAKYTDLGQIEIAEMLQKSQPLISKYKNKIKELDENHNEDKKLLQKILLFQKQIDEQLKKITTTTPTK